MTNIKVVHTQVGRLGPTRREVEKVMTTASHPPLLRMDLTDQLIVADPIGQLITIFSLKENDNAEATQA